MRFVLAAILVVAACGGEPVSSDAAAVAEPAVSEVALDFTNAEGQLVCPVMGDVIATKAQAIAHTEHEGKTYWFCCDSCQHLFGDDPERYAEGRFLAHLDEQHEGKFGSCHHVL